MNGAGSLEGFAVVEVKRREATRWCEGGHVEAAVQLPVKLPVNPGQPAEGSRKVGWQLGGCNRGAVSYVPGHVVEFCAT